MERVLKMCCTDCPCFDLMAASIRKSGLEIENRCTDYSSFDLLAASILNSWPEIKNRCTEVPEMTSCVAVIANSGPEIRNRCTKVPEMIGCAAVIANSGLEIKNHCSAIVPTGRMARLRSRCRHDAASDSNFLCRKVERPAYSSLCCELEQFRLQRHRTDR